MPSTYSSNLKIELMSTGENSGTWGNITNTNLGTALEQAIVGYGAVSYASDANLTISITNTNAAQAARALVLNVTSALSLTATRELVVPTIEKQYIVQNNTTGSQSITVKTSAGTGITVPNGRKAHLYVDGTNVIQMFDFVDINGGTIDGTPIGGSSAAAGAFTSLTASGATTLNGAVALGDASGDLITVPGTINSNLLFTDNSFDIGASGANRPRNLFLAGAATVGGNLSVGGTLTLTGGLILNGNVTVGDSSADTLTVNATITSNLLFTDNTYDIGASGATRPRNLFLAGNATIGGNVTTAGRVIVDDTTDSTSAITGSIQTDGGLGVAKALFVGTTVTVNGGTANGVAYLNGSKVVTTGSALTFDGTRLTSTTGKFGTGAASNSATLMVNNPTNTATGIQLFQDSIDSWIMGMTANSGALRWSASGVDQMFLTTSGLTVGRVVTGGMGQQTGLTVIGGTSVGDGTPGVLTIGSHLNSRTIGDQIGKIDFYSNDASGGASGVQASIRGVTTSAIGDAAGLYFYTGTSSSLNFAGFASSAQQWGLGAAAVDGNSRLTLWGAAGDANGLSIYESSTGNNARLRIAQGAGGVIYNATYSTGGNYHIFQIGNGTSVTIDSSGISANPGASTAFLTGSLGARLWTPGLAIGTGVYSGLYGPSLTYLAEKSGSSWVSSGGGSAGALGIDEGYFYFARSNGVAGPGQALTWTTYLESGNAGDFSFNSLSFTRIARGTTAQRPGTLGNGMLRWNTSYPQLEVCDGTTFQKVVTEPLVTSASGGTINNDGDYRVHTFNSSGTFTLTTISGATKVLVQILLVGGGGGGGFYLGGGGGGGAMLDTFVELTTGSYTVTVGAGGSSTGSSLGYSSNGGMSAFNGGITDLYALGGGAGSNGQQDAFGANGSANTNIGCGGGGASPYGFSFTVGTVHAMFGGPAGVNGSGGAFGTIYSSLTFTGGGGGGGALGAGVAPNVGNGPVGAGGYGGQARPSRITGNSVFYAGGGGGGYGTYLANQAIGGGTGGGQGVGTAGSGANLQATAGTTNRGGGGGGGQAFSGYQQGGNGGSGVVIIRYKYQ